MTTTKTITVRVTQELIDEAYRRCHDEKMDACYNDPVALALQELTGEECSVGFANLRIGRGEMIKQPAHVHEFIGNFGKSVIFGKEERPLPFPVEFSLDLEAQP